MVIHKQRWFRVKRKCNYGRTHNLVGTFKIPVCGYPLGRSSEKTIDWREVTCKRCLAARQNKRLEGQTHTHRFRKVRDEPVYRPHPQKYYKPEH